MWGCVCVCEIPFIWHEKWLVWTLPCCKGSSLRVNPCMHVGLAPARSASQTTRGEKHALPRGQGFEIAKVSQGKQSEQRGSVKGRRVRKVL